MYLDYIEHNNIIYSIDMLRIKTYITYSTFTELEFRLKSIWKHRIKKQFTSARIQQFFYNYVIEVGEDNSFWFGFFHNNEPRSQSENTKYNLTIEFNPNKVKDDNILFYLLSLSGDWYIKSFDIAFDLKVNILDIIYDIGLKRSTKIFNNGYDDKTIYIGTGNGRIKIYNKKIESNLNILGDLTRVEVSNELDDFPIGDIKLFNYSEKNLPSLYLNQYLYSFKDYEDKTLLAILYAVQNNFPVKDLSRRYRQKVKNLFEGGCKIRFVQIEATKIFSRVIFHYFINNQKVRWK